MPLRPPTPPSCPAGRPGEAGHLPGECPPQAPRGPAVTCPAPRVGRPRAKGRRPGAALRLPAWGPRTKCLPVRNLYPAQLPSVPGGEGGGLGPQGLGGGAILGSGGWSGPAGNSLVLPISSISWPRVPALTRPSCQWLSPVHRGGCPGGNHIWGDRPGEMSAEGSAPPWVVPRHKWGAPTSRRW